MIAWVDAQLTQWGEWLQSGRGATCPTAKWDTVGRSNVRTAVVPIKNADLDSSRTHDWVLSLPEAEQRLLLEVYCTPRTTRQNAVKLGISLRTMYARLHAVQVAYARGRNESKK